MNALRLAALGSLLVGVALVAAAAVAGDVQVGLFLVIPFVATSSPLAGLGMLLVFAALPLWLLGHARPVEPVEPPHARAAEEDAREPPTRARHGGVILLGPIPILWGSDRRILPWMVVAGALLLALAVVATLLLR